MNSKNHSLSFIIFINNPQKNHPISGVVFRDKSIKKSAANQTIGAIQI
jgi:hypothetical protein